MRITYLYRSSWGEPWEVSTDTDLFRSDKGSPYTYLAGQFVKEYRNRYDVPSERILMFQAGAAWMESVHSDQPISVWPNGKLLFRVEKEDLHVPPIPR